MSDQMQREVLTEDVSNTLKKVCLEITKGKSLSSKFCKEKGLKSISELTIGRVTKKYHLYYSLDKSYRKRGKKRYRNRVKRSPKVEQFGYREVDTIVIFITGVGRYIFNAVDVKSRFQFSYGYTKANSMNALDVFKKLEEVYPVREEIKVIQTENGSKFKGHFERYLKQKEVNHKWI